MFAVIETGGKQVIVRENAVIFIEKIPGKVGEKVSFDKVLMFNEKVGRPYVKNAVINGVIQKQGKDRKIVIYRTKPKSNWKRKQGHRQPYTRVLIEPKVSEVK